MKVILAPRFGFCAGVQNALQIAESAAQRKGATFTLGELVHNPQVTDGLVQRGILPVDRLDEVKAGIVITRSHGIDPAVIAQGRRRGLTMIDTTCPYVRRAQRIARQLQEEGYPLVIVGRADHPEIQALLAHLNQHQVHVAATAEFCAQLPPLTRMGVVAQTTESLDNFSAIVQNLIRAPSCQELRVFDTICKVVRQRQQDVKELAHRVDAIIVAGGRHSSNSRKLASLSRSVGVPTYFVESTADLDVRRLSRYRTVGVTGGTSTPGSTILAIERMLRSSPADV